MCIQVNETADITRLSCWLDLNTKVKFNKYFSCNETPGIPKGEDDFKILSSYQESWGLSSSFLCEKCLGKLLRNSQWIYWTKSDLIHSISLQWVLSKASVLVIPPTVWIRCWSEAIITISQVCVEKQVIIRKSPLIKQASFFSWYRSN